jgi:hypothetical protein
LCGPIGHPTAQPINLPAQAAAVAYARGLLARSIEPTLPPVRLEEWLEQTIGSEPLQWSVTDCDLKSSSRLPPERRLLCIGAEASERSQVYLRFHLLVGNGASGVTGAARVLPQSFAACNPLDYDAIDSIQPFRRLTDLPAIVAQLRNVCRREK